MNTKKILMVAICALSLIQLSPANLFTPVSAANNLWQQQEGLGSGGEISQTFGGDPKDIRITIVQIIKVLLGFLGVILLVLLVYAGFKYMTSQGDQEQISSAISIIKTAIIGLLIVLSAYAIADYVMSCAFDIARDNSIWMCK